MEIEPAPTPSPAPIAFADTLPADIREQPAFRDIKDLDGLARGFLGAQRLLGHRPEEMLVLPAAADDADGWNAVYARLGRPATPADYKLAPPAKLPDGLTFDPKQMEGFQGAAHAAGLSPAQVEKLFNWYGETQIAQHTERGAAAAARETAALAGLRTEWGQAFDQNVALAKGALAHYGGAELTAYLEESRLGNDPRLIKVFATLGKGLSEDGLIGRGGGGSGLQSPTEARQSIAALQADPAFVKSYNDKSATGHADAVQRMKVLYEQAYPADAAA